jgi:hypothetical protein
MMTLPPLSDLTVVDSWLIVRRKSLLLAFVVAEGAAAAFMLDFELILPIASGARFLGGLARTRECSVM